MKKLSRITAMLLALVLLLAGCAMPGQNAVGTPPPPEPLDPYTAVIGENKYYEPFERRTVPYADMEYARPDIEAIRTRAGELAALILEAPDFDTVVEHIGEMNELSSVFYTMRNLANLATFRDTDDAFFEEELEVLTDAAVEMDLIWIDFDRSLLDSQWAEAYKREVGTYHYKQTEDSLLLNSPTVEAYKKERSQLENEYDRLFSTLTVAGEGGEYTYSDIMSLSSAAEANDLLYRYYDEYKDMYADMLLRMVELDKLTAHELGFTSAIDMYYLSFQRDYSAADARALITDIQEMYVPLMGLPGVWDDYELGTIDMATTFAELPGALAQLDPELKEAWEFMLEYGLYDCEARPTKMTSAQFTIYMSSYDAPFVFTNWDDSFRSATTLVHEFGHFYDRYVHYDSSSGNLDLAEVYSQGLEMLMYPLYDNLTPHAELAEAENLGSMLVNGLIFQSIQEEFQFRLYELDTFDADILGNLLQQVYADFMLGYPPEEVGPNYEWLRLSHIFTSPFYTISYVTSALAALQIWAVGRDDWNKGVETYLTLIHTPQNQPFDDLLESAGLQSVFSTKALTDIAGHFEDFFWGYYENAA